MHSSAIGQAHRGRRGKMAYDIWPGMKCKNASWFGNVTLYILDPFMHGVWRCIYFGGVTPKCGRLCPALTMFNADRTADFLSCPSKSVLYVDLISVNVVKINYCSTDKIIRIMFIVTVPVIHRWLCSANNHNSAHCPRQVYTASHNTWFVRVWLWQWYQLWVDGWPGDLHHDA